MQIQPGLISIIDNYILSDKEIIIHLKHLSDFIDHIDTPFEEQKEKFYCSYSIAQIALKNFKNWDNETQQQVFHIAQRLTEQNDLLCFDQPTVQAYQTIITLWAQFSYVQTAITHISIFLTPARFSISLSTQELNRAQCLIAFAVKYFKWLEKDHQKSIECLSNMITTCPPLQELLNDSQLKTRYHFLIRLLQHCPSPLPSVSSPAQPLPSSSSPGILTKIQHLMKPKDNLAIFEEDCVLVVESEEEQKSMQIQIEKELKAKEHIKALQLEKICRRSYDICQSYIPLSWLGLNFQQQLFIQDFDQRFPPVAKQLFFQPPSPVSPLQFQILYQSLVQITRFLQALNKNQIAQSKEVLHKLLASTLEKLFLQWQPEQSPMNAFVSLLTVNTGLQLIEHLMTPDTFYFILDRILSSDPWDLEDYNDTKIPPKVFKIDEKLTEQLGNILEELGQALIHLGNPKWSANVLTNGLLTIVKRKKYEFAKQIQQSLHQIKSSPCSMKPLLVIYHILLHQQQDKLQASWFNWQKMDQNEKIKRKKVIETQLNTLLYQVILKEVESYSLLGGWMIDNTSSIKNFCVVLTQRLWQLFQQEENIKWLIFNLLKGIEKAKNE